MSFDAASVLTPDGLIDLGWWNGKSKSQVLGMIDGFMTDLPAVVADIEDDADAVVAEKAWAYAASYSWIAADLSTRLGTIEIKNEVLKTASKEGPAFFEREAAKWLAKFYELVPNARPATNRLPPTASYTASFRP